MLINLLPELWEQILSYCSLDEIKNLACTNSEYYEEIKEVLFHTINITPSKILIKRLKAKELENLSYAKVVRMNIHYLSQSSVEAIRKLDNIVEIELYGSNDICEQDVCGQLCEHIDGTNISTLCKGLHGLKKCNISNTNSFTDAEISHIANFVTLEDLNLSYCRITDVGLSCFVTLSYLKKLDVSYSCLTDIGMCHIANFVLLEELSWKGCGITNAGFSCLVTLKKLKKLDFSYSGLTDIGLSYIANLVTLQDLNLSNCQITDVGLSCIVTLTNLKKLDVSHSCITDEGMCHIANLVTLQDLSLKSCGITDAGLFRIVSLKKLRKLNINWMPGLTDGGIYIYDVINRHFPGWC